MFLFCSLRVKPCYRSYPGIAFLRTWTSSRSSARPARLPKVLASRGTNAIRLSGLNLTTKPSDRGWTLSGAIDESRKRTMGSTEPLERPVDEAHEPKQTIRSRNSVKLELKQNRRLVGVSGEMKTHGSCRVQRDPWC